ncbi:MAG: hypothetical protein AB1Z98_27575 [Nannocystaceae bacterium]
MTAAAADQDWIQDSLARLEALEGQREQLTATGQTAKLAELDEEIAGLYEALESVAADDDDAEPANQSAAAPMAATAAAPAMAPAMNPSASFDAGSSLAPPTMATPPDYSTDHAVDDIDLRPPRSKAPLVVVALLLIGGGAGAFFFLGKGAPEEAKPEPTAPAVVIKAGEIVEDTQEPVVAKGAEGDRTRGTEFKQSSQGSAAKRPSSSGSSNKPARSSSRPAKKDDGRKVSVSDSKDPLAGID